MTPRQLNTRSRSAYTVREAAPRSAKGSVPTRDNAAESLGQEGVRCAANQNQNKKKGKSKMKLSVYKSYDELPLFLNSDLVAKTLGIAPSSAYELMHEKDFPLCISATVWSFQKKSSSSGWRSTRRAVPLHEKNETSRWMGACEKLLPRPQRASRFRFARWINRCLHLPAASCRPKDWPVSSKYCDYG